MNPNSPSCDALFIGSSTRDLLMIVEAPPESDRRIAASSYAESFGGVASTAAAAFRHLGGKAGIITAIGGDETGRLIREDLAARGIDPLVVHTFPGSASSLSMIQVEHSGKRCLTCYGGCIDRLTMEHIDMELVKRAKVLHIGVMDFDVAEELCRRTKKETDTLVSIDGGNIPLDAAKRLLPWADYFIPDNKTAMTTLGMEPAEACRWYVSQGCRVAAVTAAEQGIWAFDGRELLHVPAISVRVLDTTGAGDNFHGAFLWARTQGYELRRALRFAGVFASLSCEGLGGRGAYPAMRRVESLMFA